MSMTCAPRVRSKARPRRSEEFVDRGSMGMSSDRGETKPADVGQSRRVDVEIFIVHPKMAPADITSALGLEATFAHRVGDQRKTPNGTLLEGQYPDTRWRHSIRYELEHQWFADKVSLLANRLMLNK